MLLPLARLASLLALLHRGRDLGNRLKVGLVIVHIHIVCYFPIVSVVLGRVLIIVI